VNQHRNVRRGRRITVVLDPYPGHTYSTHRRARRRDALDLDDQIRRELQHIERDLETDESVHGIGDPISQGSYQPALDPFNGSHVRALERNQFGSGKPDHRAHQHYGVADVDHPVGSAERPYIAPVAPLSGPGQQATERED
jgi:hypothetical protein